MNQTIEEITVEEAMRRVEAEDAILLDVRTPQEYCAEHVEGVRWIPLDQLSQRVGELDKDKVILACFCRSGSRSLRACEILKSLGFKKLFNVRGGLLAWKQAGFKTVSGA
jgi:rhodanese-related sulfurtransferase